MARYRHPKHGYLLTCYGDDLAALKAAGWVLDEPAPVAPEPAPEPALTVPGPVSEPAVVATSVSVPQAAPQFSRRKRGR